MMSDYKIDIYDTGDGTVWCFEVFKDGKLIGNSRDQNSRDEALLSAKQFVRWYLA